MERSLSPPVTAARTALLAEVHAATSYAFRSPQDLLKHSGTFVTELRSGQETIPRLPHDKTGSADTHFDAAVFSTLNDIGGRMDYFAPLKTWLDEQIKGKPVGW